MVAPVSFAIVMAPEEARRVVAGRKTQLRRLAQRDPLTGRMRHSMTLEPGATFDIQATVATVEDPHPAPVASIAVLAVREQLLRDITVEEAKAEGWRSLAEFADAWMARHDRAWPLLEEQMCGTCRGQAIVDGERCPAGCDDVGVIQTPVGVEDDQVVDVFARVHGGRLVRVVEFQLEQHRFLHRRSDALYTADPRQALQGAGEAVDQATLECYAKTNRDAFANAQLRHLDETLQLEELRALAREQGIADARDLRRAEDRRLYRARQREAARLRAALRAQLLRRAA